MKLSYRGANYELNQPTLEITEEKVGGVYRGSPWKIHHYQRQNRRHQFPIEFTYRGIHYTRN